MRKLLRTRDVLFLSLGFFADVLAEFRDPFSLRGSYYETFFGFVPSNLKKRNYHHLIWRSFKTGYIEKIVKNGDVFLRLTSKGKEKITRDFSLLKFQNARWDGKWRVVVFDIKELTRRTRDMLRDKLKEMGFGMLQQSVYISPHDIAKDFSEFIQSLGLSNLVYVMEVSRISSGDLKALVNNIWKLDNLNERYESLIEKVENSHLKKDNGRGSILNIGKLNIGEGEKTGNSETEEPKKTSKSNANKFIKTVYNEYLELLVRDPFLPKELLPVSWYGYKVKSMFKELFKKYALSHE